MPNDSNVDIKEFLEGKEDNDAVIAQKISREIAVEINKANMDQKHMRKLSNLQKAEEDLDNVD